MIVVLVVAIGRRTRTVRYHLQENIVNKNLRLANAIDAGNFICHDLHLLCFERFCVARCSVALLRIIFYDMRIAHDESEANSKVFE